MTSRSEPPGADLPQRVWWMYGGYVWLTNTRTPSHAPERLLLLLGMAGFLVIGLSVPHAFGTSGHHGADGLALGLGYLLVTLVHSALMIVAFGRPGARACGGRDAFPGRGRGLPARAADRPPWYRAAGAAVALAAWPAVVVMPASAGIALLTAVVAGALAAERQARHATVEA